MESKIKNQWHFIHFDNKLKIKALIKWLSRRLLQRGTSCKKIIKISCLERRLRRSEGIWIEIGISIHVLPQVRFIRIPLNCRFKSSPINHLSRFIHKSSSSDFSNYSHSIFTINHNYSYDVFVYNNIIWTFSSSLDSYSLGAR